VGALGDDEAGDGGLPGFELHATSRLATRMLQFRNRRIAGFLQGFGGYAGAAAR
jgi:hypothetical protein